MSVMRYLSPALLTALLSACEPKVEPAKVAPEKQPSPAVVDKQALVSPTPEPAVAAVAPAEAPAPRAKPAAAALDKTVKEPEQSRLDLSLPAEFMKRTNAGHADDGAALAPLLPPLFETRQPAVSPFQISGRLITNEGDEDYWNSVEGAELQLEFKR